MHLSYGYEKTYMHHLGITPTIGLIEQVEHLLLKRLAVFVNCLSSLTGRNQTKLAADFLP